MMVNASYANEIHEKTVSEVALLSVDLRGYLDEGESASSIISTTEVGSSDLTISNEAVSTGSLTIQNQSVPAGEAMQMKVDGGTKSTTYTIRVKFVTDSSPAQTRIVNIRLKVIADS